MFANIADRNKILVPVFGKIGEAQVFEGDRSVEIGATELIRVKTNLDKAEIEMLSITTVEELFIDRIYEVSVEGIGRGKAIPSGIFDTEYFKENYIYDGDDLGAYIHGDTTTFKLWAPTATSVALKLFHEGEGGEPLKVSAMTRGERGVWETTENCGHGTYYLYEVTTAVGTQEAVDPYAKAGGINGQRGMVVDFDRTNPCGWENDTPRADIRSYSDATIWEVHVRDFSNMISTSKYRGKYLAFTEEGLKNEDGQPVGIDYLKKLGVSHVHLLPVYDYASVDEHNCSNFNWGYDPQNYNIPEGSYSTDPYHGEVRITEYKQMVQALHNAGIGVVMDMVYNHTYDANSNLNKTVPYYYYRYTGDGKNTNASGCGNDTASERAMFSKYMVDSCAMWVKEYHLDGLRFDLMGLHDVETMQKVERVTHTINPHAIIYGEGWDMGATIDGRAQANQKYIGEIVPTGEAVGGIAVFNDVIRDGLKGSVFEEDAQGYVNGDPGERNWAAVWFGINGGSIKGTASWTVPAAQVVNYMSAHDNYSLWDKLLLSNPKDSDLARAEMNKLGAAIMMISKGAIFWQAGEEMLRTKDGDENSYMSPDKINNMDWSALKKGSLQHKTMLYYKGLIDMRAHHEIFRSTDTLIHAQSLANRAVILTYDDKKGGKAKVVLNARDKDFHISFGEEWHLIADEKAAGSSPIRKEASAKVRAISARVYINDHLAEQLI